MQSSNYVKTTLLQKQPKRNNSIAMTYLVQREVTPTGSQPPAVFSQA